MIGIINYFKETIKSFRLNETSKILLLLLIVTDIIFMIFHVLHFIKWVDNPLFYISRDLGYAEIYQYIKEFWIILLLLMIAKDKRRIVYLAWSILFLYILLDDSLKIHETFGNYLVNYFDIQPGFGLRAKDFGELGTSFLFGGLLFLFLGWSYFKSDKKDKTISNHLFLLFMILIFFGVFIDMIGIILHGTSVLNHFIILIEDGGEMIIMSVIVCYLFNLKISLTDKYIMEINEKS